MNENLMYESEPLITIYTCVYNMADKIERAFNSVKNLDYHNIEHLIIDDGSTDNLDQVVENYTYNVCYPVVYIKKPNGGKHTAENIAFRNSTGVYLVQLDADDELLPDALRRFMHHWAYVSNRADGDCFWCVSCAVRNQFHDALLGEAFPEGVNDMNEKLREKVIREVRGEKCGCMRRDVVSQFQFPEPNCVNFVTESVVWNEIGRKWKTYYSNDIVRIYYVNEGESLSRPYRSPQYFANLNWSYRYDKSVRKAEWTVLALVKYVASYYWATEEYRRNYSLWDMLPAVKDRVICGLICIPFRLIALVCKQAKK